MRTAAVTLRPRVLGGLFVDVYRVSAHVSVVGIPVVPAVAIEISAVIRVKGVAVAVTAVVAAIVVTAVPARIAVVRPAVIDHSGGVPTTVPTAVSPAATSSSPTH